MKMWKLLCYDIKYGCIKNLKLLLFPVIFEMAVTVYAVAENEFVCAVWYKYTKAYGRCSAI